jgi:hypothetical protein
MTNNHISYSTSFQTRIRTDRQPASDSRTPSGLAGDTADPARPALGLSEPECFRRALWLAAPGAADQLSPAELEFRRLTSRQPARRGYGHVLCCPVTRTAIGCDQV